MRLVGGMFRNVDTSLFGLRECQMRSREQYHNAGWYNCVGDKLGWGDLDKNDIERIMNELDDDELFIILSEQDSYWKFVTHHHPACIGFMNTTSPDELKPGMDYVREHAMAFIRKGEHKWINPYPRPMDGAMMKGEWYTIFDEYATKVERVA